MAVSKKDRLIIFNKFGGRCAYCGTELQKGWHVDEVEPVRRKEKIIRAHWINKTTGLPLTSEERHFGEEWYTENAKFVETKTVPDGCMHPENFRLDNQMPACASCNINKHGMDIEGFRKQIQGFMKHLNEINTQYKIAKRYGLVFESGNPVVFYFEKVKSNP